MSDNPFDQFDSTEANPFDQFDETPKSKLSAVSATNAASNDYGDVANDPDHETPNIAMGAARSLYHLGERGGNLALKVFRALGSKDSADTLAGHGFGSDEDLANREDTDKALLDTAGGKTGSLITDIGLTAPVGEAGALIKAGKGAGFLMKTLAAMGRGGAEGAVQGELTGNSEGGAGTGAAIGTGLGAAGRLVKAVAGTGLVRKSADALRLEEMASNAGHDMRLPLSVAASNPVVRGAYHSGSYVIPFMGHQLDSQAADAEQAIRDMAAERATPQGVKITKSENEMSRRGKIQAAFDKKYADTVGSYQFNVPTDFRDQVVRNIEASMPEVDDVTKHKVATLIDQNMARYSSGKSDISGTNLLRAKNDSNELFAGLNSTERQALGHGTDTFNDVISNDLTQGYKDQNLGDLEEFNRLGEQWRDFKPYSRAVHAAKVGGGDFSAAQLAAAAKPGSELYDLGVLGNKVLGRGADSGTPARALRTLGHTAGLGSALYHPVIAGGAMVGGNLAATRAAQRLMTGDTRLQLSLAEALKGRYAGDITGALRRAGVATGVD